MATNPSSEKVLKFNVRIALPPEGVNCNAGLGSSYVFNLKSGDTVYATGPHGDFHIQDGKEEMVYIGGGAGMAPLRSHISYLIETQKTGRKVSFWYGARSLQELYYDAYFMQLAAKNKNFSFHVALSEPKSEDHWNGYNGFIHKVLDEHYLSKHSSIQNISFYLCGPPAMISACRTLLAGYGVADEKIRFDEF